MSRQKCCRKVGCIPVATIYRPVQDDARGAGEVVLCIDEFEAVRLADYSGLYHEEAARKMDVSRQTFGRIIQSARNKIADALINGRMLKIEGGNVSVDYRACARCGKCRMSVDCPDRFKEDTCPRRFEDAISPL